jgi:hypothetical protein
MSNLMMPSRVLLYGRVISGITIDATVFDLGTGGIPGLGNNRFLREQFNDSGYNMSPPPSAALEPCFALIYGFEFEGRYYDIMVPTIMLVHGPGVAHRDTSICRVEEPFPAIELDIVVWPYDKADFSLRLDPCSGPLESILIEAEFDDSEMAAEASGRQVSGRQVSGRQVSGRQVRGRQVRGKKY